MVGHLSGVAGVEGAGLQGGGLAPAAVEAGHWCCGRLPGTPGLWLGAGRGRADEGCRLSPEGSQVLDREGSVVGRRRTQPAKPLLEQKRLWCPVGPDFLKMLFHQRLLEAKLQDKTWIRTPADS